MKIKLNPECYGLNGVVYSNKYEGVMLVLDKWVDGTNPIEIEIHKAEEKKDESL